MQLLCAMQIPKTRNGIPAWKPGSELIMISGPGDTRITHLDWYKAFSRLVEGGDIEAKGAFYAIIASGKRRCGFDAQSIALLLASILEMCVFEHGRRTAVPRELERERMAQLKHEIKCLETLIRAWDRPAHALEAWEQVMNRFVGIEHLKKCLERARAEQQGMERRIRYFEGLGSNLHHLLYLALVILELTGRVHYPEMAILLDAAFEARGHRRVARKPNTLARALTRFRKTGLDYLVLNQTDIDHTYFLSDEMPKKKPHSPKSTRGDQETS